MCIHTYIYKYKYKYKYKYVCVLGFAIVEYDNKPQEAELSIT